ncbi:MAG: phosphatidylglycerol---prolipoprotein diacylglyceryl transferase [Candidatus Sumerlaeota bacterium]|nr:phosphatidylglycerol---prolipoprotein diacylglyceryl transferase [Candidatus Sumerlaeota bacterium]
MHPILFSIGDFFIGTYGLMIALGLLAGIWVASWRGRRRGFSSELFFDLAFVAVLSGFGGGRLLYILLNFSEFLSDPMAMLLSRTGFVFLGGFVGAVGVVVWYLRRRGLPVLAVGDILAPSLAITHGFGRIGCHLAGCCWGSECSVPGLGLRLKLEEMPNGYPFSNAYLDQIDRGLIPHDAVHSLPVWPVQLMESAGLLLMAGALIWIAARKPRPAGQILGLYLIGYAILRFGLEFLRGDADRGMFFGGAISTSQLISLALVPAGIVLLAKIRTNPPSPHSHPSVAPPPPGEKTEEKSGTEQEEPASSDAQRIRRRRKR